MNERYQDYIDQLCDDQLLLWLLEKAEEITEEDKKEWIDYVDGMRERGKRWEIIKRDQYLTLYGGLIDEINMGNWAYSYMEDYFRYKILPKFESAEDFWDRYGEKTMEEITEEEIRLDEVLVEFEGEHYVISPC